MNRLETHIDYLMSRNDCVIIPGIGALLARYVHASIDADSGVATPPHREFSFNSGLVYNDGMIAHSMSRAMEIPYEVAVSKVNEAVAELDRTLHSVGHVELGNVGSLTLDGETLDFMPFYDRKILSSHAFLPKVKAQSEAKRVSGPDEPNPLVEKYLAELQSHSRSAYAWRQFARIAASIVLLIGICFVASTPISVDNAALASLSVELKQVSPQDLMPAPTVVEDVMPSINVIPSTGSYLSIDVNDARAQMTNQSLYYIVVGSFYAEDEAKRFLQQNPQHHLRYVASKQWYRVYDGAYATMDEAAAAIKVSPFANKGAWISHQ